MNPPTAHLVTHPGETTIARLAFTAHTEYMAERQTTVPFPQNSTPEGEVAGDGGRSRVVSELMKLCSNR